MRRNFKPFVLPPELDHKEGIERYVQQCTPVYDNEKNTYFDIRGPANSHMSSVMLLEREFEVHCLRRLATEDDNDTWHPAKAPWNMRAEVNQPGFSLQNNMDEVSFNFNGGSVVEKPSQWLPWYSELHASRDLNRHVF